MKQKVAVGLSGGVDSAVSAALLVQAGYDVTGVFLECWRAPGCRTEEDRKDALDVALTLQIPFEVLDFKQAYREKVVDYFYREYQAGRTPNPDVMCNREIKFGLFYEWAMKKGFDFVATGHYARTSKFKSQNSKGKITSQKLKASSNSSKLKADSYHLLRGVDEKKDQSYFLYQLRQEQLAHILFPIGHLNKQQVRNEAKKRGLSVANKPDSQGICFIGEVSVPEFLKSLGMREKVGKVFLVGDNEAVIGKHRGVGFYTIGQRFGQGLSAKSEVWQSLGFEPTVLPPFFVVDKDIRANRLIVGTHEQATAGEFMVGDLLWLNDRLTVAALATVKNLSVRIRHLGELLPVQITKLQTTDLVLRLSVPAFGVAPGQAAVFYNGDEILGGGIII